MADDNKPEATDNTKATAEAGTKKPGEQGGSKPETGAEGSQVISNGVERP